MWLFHCITEKCWFEIEKEKAKAAASDTTGTQEPSVPSGTADDNMCPVCEEDFDQFFDSKEEEWALKSAVSFEGRNYHPLCLEDHKVRFVDTLTI